MITILTTLIIVGGFSFVSWRYLKSIDRLILLTKAKDLTEVREIEDNYKKGKVEIAETLVPLEIEDYCEDQTPDQIRETFRKPINTEEESAE